MRFDINKKKIVRASLKTQLINEGKAFASFYEKKVQGKQDSKSINSYKIFAPKLLLHSGTTSSSGCKAWPIGLCFLPSLNLHHSGVFKEALVRIMLLNLRIGLSLLCILLLTTCTYTKNNITQKSTINILPIRPIDSNTLYTLYNNLIKKDNAFNYEILPTITIPDSLYTYTKGKRIDANKALKYIAQYRADSITTCLAITNTDICVTKYNDDGSIKRPISTYTDFGIFGLASLGKGNSIISSNRLKNNNANIYHYRIYKVAIHELGHTFNLPHCTNTKCVMTDAAEKLSTVDLVAAEYCIECKNKCRIKN
jgi:archaemetzincin